jgi:hypothetical protein
MHGDAHGEVVRLANQCGHLAVLPGTTQQPRPPRPFRRAPNLARHSVACLSTDSRWPMPAWRPCRAQLLSACGRVDHADEKLECQGAAQSQRGCGSPGPGPQARSVSTPVEPSRGPGSARAGKRRVCEGGQRASPPSALDWSDSGATGPGAHRAVCTAARRAGLCATWPAEAPTGPANARECGFNARTGGAAGWQLARAHASASGRATPGSATLQLPGAAMIRIMMYCSTPLHWMLP